MYSPFPGMDPYLEGYLWADVHQALAYQFRRQLAPLVTPKYAVRLAITMIMDRVPAHELGIIYPDVEIIGPSGMQPITGGAESIAVAPAPVSVPLSMPVPTRLVSVEVRDSAANTLVTSIEILSPANKREPGLSSFLNKRDELRLAAVHILEIDLLRRGTRPWPDTELPSDLSPSPYMATLIRASSPKADIWPITLRQSLPLLPVPLRPPDNDVALNLQEALNTVYAEAQYDLTIDYSTAPPPPPFAAADAAWIDKQVRTGQS